MADLRLCHGNRPWNEVSPQYDEEDQFVDVWTRLECHHCHAMTKAFPTSEEAERAWNAGEVTIPDWAKK